MRRDEERGAEIRDASDQKEQKPTSEKRKKGKRTNAGVMGSWMYASALFFFFSMFSSSFSQQQQQRDIDHGALPDISPRFPYIFFPVRLPGACRGPDLESFSELDPTGGGSPRLPICACGF